MFFGCSWAYIGQPHSHIRWATAMPFVSINSTNPRTNLWDFRKKKLKLAILKISIFLSQPFWFFCFIPMKISPNLYCRMDGSILIFFLVFRKFLAMLNITVYSVIKNLASSKGQIVSKANFEDFIWTKNGTKIFLYFCSRSLKWIKSKRNTNFYIRW